MTQYGFHFDGSRCTGCKTCMLACKDCYDLPSELAFRQVYEYGSGAWAKDASGAWTTDSFIYYISGSCNHCDSPACVAACPQGAVHKDGETGLVLPDDTKCIGCGTCAEACPYGQPHVDSERGKMVKCTGCYDRVTAGKNPICVEACPQRVLDFGEIEGLRARYGKVDAIAPLPDPSETAPNLVVTAPANSEPWDKASGEIENVIELV